MKKVSVLWLSGGIVIWGLLLGLIVAFGIGAGLRTTLNAIAFFIFMTAIATAAEMFNSHKFVADRPWFWFFMPILGIIGAVFAIVP